MKYARWKFTVVMLVTIVILNFIPWTRSLTFEQQSFPSAFARSWGWPISAVATTSDEGIELVDASVVFEGTTVFQDIQSGNYPHISVNSFCIIIDLIVATFVAFATFVLGAVFEKRWITNG